MFIPLWLILILWAAPLRAGETLSGAAGAAYPLDAANPFARAQALGSAFTGVADDATALFSNPAGLAALTAPQVLSDSDLWLVGTFEQTLLAALPLAPHWGMGFAGQYLGFGSLDGYDATGASMGSYGADRFNFKAGLGWEFLPRWDLGVEAGLDDARVDQTSEGDFSGGLGLLGELWPGFKIGLSFDHVGLAGSAGPLSSLAQVGASYRLSLGNPQDLLIALGGAVDGGSDSFLQGGLEYGWERSLFIRLGYRAPLQENTLGGFSGLTAGAGLAVSNFQVDYAFSPYGGLGNAHRVSLGYYFEPPKPSPTPFQWPPPPPPPEAGSNPEPSPAPSRPPADRLVVESPLSVDPIAAGRELEKAGQYNQAMELYQLFLREEPRNAGLWEAMGNLYARFGRKADAAVCLQRALALRPGDGDLLRRLEALGGNP
ncbi:MAG TPA: tetratricopeptide repeat protein [bacterium]|nr:tetratricopeptide repeat protein [bacterium]